MANNKEDKPMHTAVVEETGLIDYREQLAPKQVKAYVEHQRERGLADYNNGSILVKSRHPMDECLRRGIIEQHHHDSAKRIRNYRDCSISKLSGRTYNAPGEGDPEMDAATVYAIVMREMQTTVWGRNRWKLISIVCFTEPNIDGHYFSEADYSALFSMAPNIQAAFEASDISFMDAREKVKKRIEDEKKRLEAELAAKHQ